MISKNILFIYSSIFFLIAIFINNLTKELKTSLLVLLILVVLFLCYYLFNKKYILILVISVLGFLLGLQVSQSNIDKIISNENSIKKYYNNKHYLVLKIGDINKVDDFKIEYNTKVIQISESKINNKIYANIKVAKNYELNKGDIISTSTKINEIKDFEEFSYKNYMLSKKIYFKSNIYDFEIIKQNNINSIEKYIISIRKNIINTINKIYTKEEAIFLGGILIGARESLPNNLKTDFNNSGLTHFIAVSGFNITIIVIFFGYIIKYLPINIRIILITIFILLFTVLVGFTAPVIRASIMGVIGYYIISSGRKGSILAILLFTLSVMTIVSPYSLNYDISLHLSFLAVLGIIYTGKFFERIFNFLPNILEIKSAFILTLSSLSFSLPIIILNFKQVSILSPIANIAVSWTIPIAMLLGFISIIVYFVYPIAGIITGYITWIFLKWDIIVVHFFGKQHWSILKFDLGVYKYHIEILYFIIIIFFIIWFRKKEEQAA